MSEWSNGYDVGQADAAERFREHTAALEADRDNLGVALEAALADLEEARAERDDALDALAAIRGGPDG